MFSDPQVTLAYSASDSQITLTNPLPALELYSSKRSVTNTVLSQNGKPYISISTVDRAASCTEIKDLRTDQLLVTIQRRTIVPDTITFEQRFDDQQLKIKNWLVELKTGDTRIREWLVKKPIGNFIWRSTVDIRLALYAEYDLERPIAWVKPETRAENATVIIERGAESFKDEVIAAFVVCETYIRMDSKRMETSNCL